MTRRAPWDVLSTMARIPFGLGSTSSLGALALVAVVATGVTSGFALQRSVLDDDTPVAGTVDADPASGSEDGSAPGDGAVVSAVYYDCPGGEALGALHDGDRILTVGRHVSAEGWLGFRSPDSSGRVTWIAAAQVVPDGDVAGLPDRDCDDGDAFQLVEPVAPDTTVADEDPDVEDPDPDEVAQPEVTTTVEGTATTRSTPTTAPRTTTTRRTTTTTGTPPTTTAPPSTTTTTKPPAPTVALGPPSNSTISEETAGGYSCGNPKTSVVRAQVQNATSVTMSWAVNTTTGSKAMTRQGTLWQAILGPFPDTTISGGSANITVTVVASGAGGSTSRTTSVGLNDCFFG